MSDRPPISDNSSHVTGHSSLAPTSAADRDFPEDRWHPAYEDGFTCLNCAELFSGVRGRYVCRVCSTPVTVRDELLQLRAKLSTLNPQPSTQTP